MSLAKGGAEFLAANIMIAMMPEDLLLEKVFEALQEYKQKKDMGLNPGPPPQAELVALVMKWKTKDKTPDQIIEETMKVNSVASMMDTMEGNGSSN